MMIQNIEEMRREEGIDDPELRLQIGALKRGDCVKLTFLASQRSPTGETLPVRITSMRKGIFRGKLMRPPMAVGLVELAAGTVIVFTAAHIHSLSSKRPAEKPLRRMAAATRPARH